MVGAAPPRFGAPRTLLEYIYNPVSFDRPYFIIFTIDLSEYILYYSGNN